MELYFAKLLGIYFIVVGLVVMLRRKSMMPAIHDLVANRALLLVLAVIELIAGVAMILTFPTPSFEISGILSVVGWMMAIESLLYLSLPSRIVQRYVRGFNKRNWYIGGGVLSIAVGLYLALSGFGIW